MPIKSAIIPYRFNDKDVLEILLIKNKDNTKWVIPKGTIEEELKPSISTTKEAFEEAGGLGISSPVLIGTHKKSNQKVPTYLLKVLIELEEYAELSKREREWHKVEDLNDFILDDDLLTLLQKAAKVIQKNSYYFEAAMETFATGKDITIKEMAKKVCVIDYKHSEHCNFEILIKRKKKFLHFSTNRDFLYKTATDIPHSLMIKLMTDNTISRAGFWSIKGIRGRTCFC